MYGNDTYEPRPERLPWMDLGELWKAVQALLDEDRVDVPWDHILAEGHGVVEEEIRAALSDGTYALHDSVDGRYLATYVMWPSRPAIVVLFELRDVGGDRRLQVLTAYRSRATRRRAHER